MVLDDLKEIVVEQLCVSESDISLDSRIVEDLGADSLDVVELIMAIESLYDIEMMDEEAEKLSTVEDVVKLITEKVEKQDGR